MCKKCGCKDKKCKKCGKMCCPECNKGCICKDNKCECK